MTVEAILTYHLQGRPLIASTQVLSLFVFVFIMG